jgi:glycosidase
MPREILSDQFAEVLDGARAAALDPASRKEVTLPEGATVSVRFPFPSPVDWRDKWIYFLMLDRFANPSAPPASLERDPPVPWNGKYGARQGGTFKGVQSQLSYLQHLGVGAIWLTPVLNNPNPRAAFPYNYHGYGVQDFLGVDERFGSDGTPATAERELAELVDEAHARGMHVVIDIVLNHAGRVFDYVRDGVVTNEFADPALLVGPPGTEASILWMDGSGAPRWDVLPPTDQLGPDDAVWPANLQRPDFFRRRGKKISGDPPPDGPIVGDFEGGLRQLVVEYDASVPGLEGLRERYGPAPVLTILIRAYCYLIARFDVDAFRIDTTMYLPPDAAQTFGNAVREFALSVGKANFFTFGEVANNDEGVLARFVGRHSTRVDGLGIDAALDFPLFDALPRAVKALDGAPVERIREVLAERKAEEEGQISSHGEAGRYFVTFLDNHDQWERFHHASTPIEQVKLGLGLLFCLQGIPCVYYGTEQGLTGTVDGLDAAESVREALWGKPAPAFDPGHELYREIRALADLRLEQPALRYGRIYFREVAGNGRDFGHSSGIGGVVAFSRILGESEVVVVANTSPTEPFDGSVAVDFDLHHDGDVMQIRHSNLGTVRDAPVSTVRSARFFPPGETEVTTRAVGVHLVPDELQVLVVR